MRRNEEPVTPALAAPPAVRRDRVDAPGRDEVFWVRLPVGAPPPVCVPDDGVGWAGLTLTGTGVVVAGVVAAGVLVAGAEEPLPDAVLTAGVADEDEEDDDEEEPFDDDGVPPELLPLEPELPFPSPLPQPE